MLYGSFGSSYLNFFAVYKNLARIKVVGAVNCSCKLRSARAHKTRKSEYLAFAKLKADVFDHIAASHIPNFKHRRSVVRNVAFRFRLGINNSADHHFDDLVLCRVLRYKGSDVFAVSHNRYPVGNPVYLVHSVRDVYHSDALVAQIIHYSEQLFNFGLRECRRRLVKNEQFRIMGNCLCNFDHLLFSYGQCSEFYRGVDVYSDFFEKVSCILFHLAVINVNARFFRFASDVNVLCDRQMVHHVEFLVYDADSCRLRFRDVCEIDRLAEIFYLTGVS